MRKVIILCAVAMMALAAASCQKEEKVLTFTASMEQTEGSKLAINNRNYLVWQGGEKVVIYNGSANRAIYTATPQIDSTFATLTLTSGSSTLSGDGSYRAFYPASATYTTVNHEIGKMSMVAESNNSTLHFKNLCGVLRVELPQTSGVSIKSIKVTADRAIAGTFSFTDTVGNPTISASINAVSEASIRYDEAVALTAEHNYFYIFLPPANYSRLTLTFANNEGKVCAKTCQPADGVTILRSHIHPVSIGNPMSFVRNDVGALSGEFSVSAAKKVRFSKGNLQYQASTGTWQFATVQYDFIGSYNSNISSTYQGWIDLFGWGTSGYHNSYDTDNTNYMPYSTSGSINYSSSVNSYGYGPSTNRHESDLTGISANYDWGVYNAISNGGNQAGLWRTLTQAEWDYLFNTRSASRVNYTDTARYCKARIGQHYGIVLFPDSYTHPAGATLPRNINTPSASPEDNQYAESQWNSMEAAGAVFLPRAGYREVSDVSAGACGHYWSASYKDKYYAYDVYFDGSTFNVANNTNRCYGLSVRLVQD